MTCLCHQSFPCWDFLSWFILEGWTQQEVRQHKARKSQGHNWYHPFLWSHLDATACKVQWLPESIANQLTLNHPMLFGKIMRGVIYKQINKETKQGWLAKMVKNVECCHALAGSGQTGILAKYPDVVKEIEAQLRALQISSLAVNVLVVHSIMLVIIEQWQPQLLFQFKCSEISCHFFRHSQIHSM